MRRILAALLCGALFLGLSACGGAPGAVSGGSQSGSQSQAAQSGDGSQGDSSQEGYQDFTRPEIGSPVVLDPPYDFDPEEMLPRDFGGCFGEDYPVETETYKLAEGTDAENEVFVIRGREEGPSVYVVAGVHGDEMAGWMTGNLLKKATIRAGTLYVLSPANPWGAAAEPRSRYVTGEEDLNRSFPGSPDGNMAQRTAHSIYQDIARAEPVFVFDLHEARYNEESRDFLGSSLIFTSLDGMDQLCMELLLATESGELCSERYNFFGPGPEGSVNHTVTTGLGIPTITIETYRGYPLERRIGDQLAIVEYVLGYYGLL